MTTTMNAPFGSHPSDAAAEAARKATLDVILEHMARSGTLEERTAHDIMIGIGCMTAVAQLVVVTHRPEFRTAEHLHPFLLEMLIRALLIALKSQPPAIN